MHDPSYEGFLVAINVVSSWHPGIPAIQRHQIRAWRRGLDPTGSYRPGEQMSDGGVFFGGLHPGSLTTGTYTRWQLKHFLFSPRSLGKWIQFDEHIF